LSIIHSSVAHDAATSGDSGPAPSAARRAVSALSATSTRGAMQQPRRDLA